MNETRRWHLSTVFGFVILVVLTSGCASDRDQVRADEQPPVVDRTEWSEQRQGGEQQSQQARETMLRLSTTAQDMDEASRIFWAGVEEHEEAHDRLESIAVDQAEPEKSAWALLRIGQGYVSMGCNMLVAPVMEESPDADRLFGRR